MRFTADGPDIPGDRLDARDDGQVIFFCGSGVSLHQAGGPTFPQLAQRVITELGVPSESTAAQVLGIAQNLPAIAGVGSVVATDQIFGLLERDFPVQDVRRAVSKADKPPERSEEHTSELQSLMRISYAVFCLKKKKAPSSPPQYIS